MGRIRTIKPEFWANEKLSSISEPALILAAALLNYADDFGYFNANPRLITAACFPIREPSVNIHGMLTELSNIGYVELRNSSDGRTWGKVVNFSTHQRVNRPSESKIEPIFNDSLNNHGALTESSLNGHCRNREQGTGNREGNINPPLSPKGENHRFNLPDALKTDAFKKAWIAWEKHRTEIRHRLTPSTKQKQLAKCARWGHDRAIAAIEHSIENGYQGLFEAESKGTKIETRPKVTAEQVRAENQADMEKLKVRYD